MTAVPGAEQSRNVEVVGYHDLEGRPAFKLAMQVVDSRWYLYLGHFWHRGWSVLDVTEPTSPRLAHFEPWGNENTWTLQVSLAQGLLVTALEAIGGEAWGYNPSGPPFDTGVLIWDVHQPTEPRLLGRFDTGGTGTHRNFYDGGRYVHLAARPDGYRGNIYLVIDIQGLAHPVEVSRWWFPGQWEAGEEEPPSDGASLHGPAYVEGDRAYLPYGRVGMIILDISDIHKPKLVSQLSFGGLGSSLGVHTVLPIPSRQLALVNTEAILEDGKDPLNYAAIVDIADEHNPRVLSFYPVPVPAPEIPYRNFAQKGGRFGPHNQHMPHHQDCLMLVENLTYLTYFNAGLRIYDISDPSIPQEVGYFVPEDPAERRGLLPTKLVVQSEDVLVDARGNIYLTDKNHGLFILRYT
ncbi:MAG: LVIVD repeat-containing protein, partial [Anaerolineae bacterium]